MTKKQCFIRILSALLLLFFFHDGFAQQTTHEVKMNYNKKDTAITMKDGVKLYTVIYSPKDTTINYPIILERTPYSCAPYGDTSYARYIGPNPGLMKEKYIFVYQDVRGRYMSEGINTEMSPYLPLKKKSGSDETTDTYETVDWLVKNIKHNNGKVGITGVSYPGFFAAMSMINPHPAIKAVSPQAPMTDEFAGDDAFHNGAFFLMDNFGFINYYGKERNGPTKDYGNGVFNFNPKDAYRFFQSMGPLSNTNNSQFFGNKCELWNEMLKHNTYDDYWQTRYTGQYFKKIKLPVLVVGGWFDAEDLYGALHTYQCIEKGEADNQCKLVMGPWTHGSWKSGEWKFYASHDFNQNTSKVYQDSIETRFFNYYLKEKDSFNIDEASIFETGSNKWTHYNSWPPANCVPVTFYLNSHEKLSLEADKDSNAFEEYVSDPKKPVPYTPGIYGARNNDFMAEDQRFATTRPDVLVFETPPLSKDVTATGAIKVKLQVSLTGSDADFIIKLIDVLPDNEPNFKNAPKGFQMAGYQRLVRADVMRGKFRNSLSKPEPFEPGKITPVDLVLNDVAHDFKKGHRIMIQIQSSWFPLIDMNPQQFMNISEAREKDFIKNNIKIWHDASHQSQIILPILAP